MIIALIVLSSILTVASAVPYIIEIIKGKTKPRVVSWFTWSVLTAIACVASFADGQYAGGILLLFATIETVSIVILGLWYGDRKFGRFDVICQLGAVVGLVLWLLFNSPEIAIIATISIDLIGALPSIKHSWQKPHEETWLTFALAGLGGVCTVLAATDWKVTAVGYPIYIAVVNVVFTLIILGRHQYAVANAPKELRDL